jgi:hypothetical protein
VADETTRPCERRRPVPTGNILQTQPNLATVSSSASKDNPSKVSIAQNGNWLAAAHFSKSRSGAPPVSLVSDMNCAVDRGHRQRTILAGSHNVLSWRFKCRSRKDYGAGGWGTHVSKITRHGAPTVGRCGHKTERRTRPGPPARTSIGCRKPRHPTRSCSIR